MPAVSVRSFKGACGFPEDAAGAIPRFSTPTAYGRAGDRTRRLFNTAVLTEARVCDGHVVEAALKAPFDLLFASAEPTREDSPPPPRGPRVDSRYDDSDDVAHP